MKAAANTIPSGRLASLDILRGFDLFLLVFLQPVAVSILSRIDSRLPMRYCIS